MTPGTKTLKKEGGNHMKKNLFMYTVSALCTRWSKLYDHPSYSSYWLQLSFMWPIWLTGKAAVLASWKQDWIKDQIVKRYQFLFFFFDHPLTNSFHTKIATELYYCRILILHGPIRKVLGSYLSNPILMKELSLTGSFWCFPWRERLLFP